MVSSSINTSNGAEALKDEGSGGAGVIHGGKMRCQDCTQGWNECVNVAKPIKGLSHGM